jgi:hypothetical protein
MDSTRTKVVTKRVYLKLPTTTRNERVFSNDRDLRDHGHDKESLTETNRPGFISTERPDLSQSTHWFEEEDKFGGILFPVRLKVSHLRPMYRILNCRHYALL